MTIYDVKTKFFLRSRKIQAALILGLQALQGGSEAAGVHLPTWLTLDWLAGLLDTITADSGLGATIIAAWGAGAAVLSYLRPDDAKLVAVPLTGTLPIAASLRAALVLLACMMTLGAPLPARSGQIDYRSPVAFDWTPASGQVAGYHVLVDQGAGPIAAKDVPVPPAAPTICCQSP